jgi:DNA-binding PadR family transcriptional regulator
VLDGALYTALHRLEARGWIASEWGLSDKGKRAKFYRLTSAGRRALKSEIASWGAYVAAMGKVLSAKP